jgi:hypothetical protein
VQGVQGVHGVQGGEALGNHVREVEIRTLGELLELATPDRPDPDSGRLRDAVAFRGCAYPEVGLFTSLDRLGVPEQPPHSKSHLEEHLLRNFIRYSRPYLPTPPVNDWEVLVVAQHHGLPTRLLDWTYSPVVAAHFATIQGRPHSHRVIWRLNWGHMHQRFGLPPLALMVEDLGRVLNEKGIGSVWELFDNERAEADEFVGLVEPPALDSRIIAQAAAFTLSSDKSRPIDEILLEAGLANCLTRFILPAEAVDRIRDQLDLCAVDERRLFPDLDGLAAEMRRYYSTSAPASPPFTGGPRRYG